MSQKQIMKMVFGKYSVNLFYKQQFLIENIILVKEEID